MYSIYLDAHLPFTSSQSFFQHSKNSLRISKTGFTFIWKSELHTKHDANLQLNIVLAFAFYITLLIFKQGSRKHNLKQSEVKHGGLK